MCADKNGSMTQLLVKRKGSTWADSWRKIGKVCKKVGSADTKMVTILEFHNVLVENINGQSFIIHFKWNWIIFPQNAHWQIQPQNVQVLTKKYSPSSSVHIGTRRWEGVL